MVEQDVLDLRRLDFVAGNYSELGALRLVPVGLFALLMASLVGGWVELSAYWESVVGAGALGAAVAGFWLVALWCRNNYGMTLEAWPGSEREALGDGMGGCCGDGRGWCRAVRRGCGAFGVSRRGCGDGVDASLLAAGGQDVAAGLRSDGAGSDRGSFAPGGIVALTRARFGGVGARSFRSCAGNGGHRRAPQARRGGQAAGGRRR